MWSRPAPTAVILKLGPGSMWLVQLLDPHPPSVPTSRPLPGPHSALQPLPFLLLCWPGPQDQACVCIALSLPTRPSNSEGITILGKPLRWLRAESGFSAVCMSLSCAVVQQLPLHPTSTCDPQPAVSHPRGCSLQMSATRVVTGHREWAMFRFPSLSS